MGSATSQLHPHGPSVRSARTASEDLQLRPQPMHLL